MQVFFDRTEPFFLTAEQQFDGIAVEVPEGFLEKIQGRKATDKAIQDAILEAGAPEDSAQDLANLFVSLVEEEPNDG